MNEPKEKDLGLSKDLICEECGFPKLHWELHSNSGWRLFDCGGQLHRCKQMKEQKWLDCIGKGWWNLVKPLIEQANLEGATILQVKEKFGGLRFYAEGSSLLNQMIDNAENESLKTCEECGKPGKLSSRRGWLKTLCEKHSVDKD